ncbi:MAG: WG repeat-containing protein [Haliscomenobacter sp.]|nr:WG repeat-containing protein [Haliscomenobacter sp.]
MVDSVGNILLKPQYDDIRVASKGLYWVQVGGKANDDGYIEGGQWGLVDSLGNVLLKPQHDAIESASKGLCKVQVGGKPNSLVNRRRANGAWWTV